MSDMHLCLKDFTFHQYIKYSYFVELLTLFVNHLNLQFLYETLMERKGDDCFCSSSDTKCWWHGLKNVNVISSLMIDENIDFKTMLELLPIGEKISFMLEF
jgi:hypothetical protein